MQPAYYENLEEIKSIKENAEHYVANYKKYKK
jgi:hypothetical protein